MKAKIFSFFRKVATTLVRAFKHLKLRITKTIDNFCVSRVQKMPDYKLIACKPVESVSVSDAETQYPQTPTKKLPDDDFDWNIVCDVV